MLLVFLPQIFHLTAKIPYIPYTLYSNGNPAPVKSKIEGLISYIPSFWGLIVQNFAYEMPTKAEFNRLSALVGIP